ncbi:tripartite tricarboxylate transporter substrate binding protein [Curvibacter sp. HBC61]|uniref:Tripartite tricarboxylate transporter substrate binding protein n=1 Tax=Curvibacter cyanobacteriorum TaxID=3026422 RepID=A0ABT5MX72_9BURK|nr:tripartite tricarboxylate transporter substrate binding protein [Curvibacter sp. HBC61]MDD0838654.1 tripartite tricarboxylate transporter substrate binding protein [Curvibacter sp. HBC61]
MTFSRQVLGLLAPALSLALLAPLSPAQAQATAPFPSQPIHIVVGFPPGGVPDTLARILAEKANLGQPIVVDNKPGAGGNLGGETVAKAKPDGYTVMMGGIATHSINGSIYPNLPFDMVKDFSPILWVAATPNVLVVHPSVPAHNVAELIALAKAQPGQLTYGTPGIGTSPHVAGEMFNAMAGVKLTHVPYRGRAQAVPELLGGHIATMFDNLPSALPAIREGKVRALGITSLKRSASAPDIPTLAEQGLTGFEADSWLAIFGPGKLPPDVQAKLAAEAQRVFSLPDVQARMRALGMEPIAAGPSQLAAHQRSEIAKWAKVIRDAGIKPE